MRLRLLREREEEEEALRASALEKENQIPRVRNFNEIDIVGEVERDDKGNLIVEFGNDHDMAKEVFYDLKG